MKILIALLFVLSACASTQVPFQKVENGVGYSVEAKGQDHFLIKTKLPTDLEPKSVVRYVARAVGEECLKNGFQYFDYTSPKDGASEGFCFKENKRMALGITFERVGLEAVPPSFVIEDLNQKTNTKLLVGDKLLKVEGREIASVSELKSLAFQYGKKGTANVQVEVLRQGKALTLSEPLSVLSNASYGPSDLEALRLN